MCLLQKNKKQKKQNKTKKKPEKLYCGNFSDYFDSSNFSIDSSCAIAQLWSTLGIWTILLAVQR